MRAAVAKGNVLKFDRNKCWIRDSKGVLRGLGTLVRKMYQLDCEISTSSQTSVTVGKDREEATLKIRGYSDPIKAKIEKGEQLESETVEDVIKEQIPSRHSERIRKSPVRYGYDEFAESCHHVAYNVVDIEEPVTLQEAMRSPYAKEWKTATSSHYNSLMENKTWKIG